MKPIILDYAVERREGIDSLYHYDFARSLNVVTVENKDIPFIDSNSKTLSLLTKTKTISERDDENFKMIEMSTHTKVVNEGSDDYNFPLEFMTKTFTNQERDDENINYN